MPALDDPGQNHLEQWFADNDAGAFVALYARAQQAFRQAGWLAEGAAVPAAGVRWRHAHFGLWRDKFFMLPADTKAATGRTLSGQVQQLMAWQRVVGDESELRAALAAMRRLTRSLGGRVVEVAAEWHFAAGLGLPHPSDFGLTIHPRLGVPYLPATAVKGLVRHWLAEEDRRGWQGRAARLLGSADAAGEMIFFDALPDRPVRIVADTITPHVGQWQPGEPREGANFDWREVPADYQPPVPLMFHAAKGLRLNFPLAPAPRIAKRPTARDDVRWLATRLREALLELGAGARTGTGYGRFTS